MYTKDEQYLIKRFLSRRIDKMRFKTYKNNREFDTAMLEIKENVKIIQDIDQITIQN